MMSRSILCVIAWLAVVGQCAFGRFNCRDIPFLRPFPDRRHKMTSIHQISEYGLNRNLQTISSSMITPQGSRQPLTSLPSGLPSGNSLGAFGSPGPFLAPYPSSFSHFSPNSFEGCMPSSSSTQPSNFGFNRTPESGNHNHIKGAKNQVKGNFVTVIGDSNQLIGDNTLIHGHGNNVMTANIDPHDLY